MLRGIDQRTNELLLIQVFDHTCSLLIPFLSLSLPLPLSLSLHSVAVSLLCSVSIYCCNWLSYLDRLPDSSSNSGCHQHLSYFFFTYISIFEKILTLKGKRGKPETHIHSFQTLNRNLISCIPRQPQDKEIEKIRLEVSLASFRHSQVSVDFTGRSICIGVFM